MMEGGRGEGGSGSPQNRIPGFTRRNVKKGQIELRLIIKKGLKAVRPASPPVLTFQTPTWTMIGLSGGGRTGGIPHYCSNYNLLGGQTNKGVGLKLEQNKA